MTVAATFAEALDLMVRQGFQTVTVGNQTVTMKNIKELIEGEEYLKAQEAATNKQSGLGIRVQRIIPRYP